MNCKKCGSTVNSNENFCSVCGAKIESEIGIQNQPQGSSVVNPAPNINNQNTNPVINSAININNQGLYNHQNSFTQPKVSEVNIEALMDSYIGKNIVQLRTGNFSFNSFFFGPLYSLYRKMWVQGFLWIAASTIASIFLGNFSYAISLILSIAISANFKTNYLRKVQERVVKIKNDNPDKNQEQLMAICRQKGGTTIIPIVVFILLTIAMFFLAATLIMKIFDEARKNAFNVNNGDSVYTEPEGTLKNLSYTIPDGFEKSIYSVSFDLEYERTDDKGCEIEIYYNANSIYSNDVNTYLNEEVFTFSSDVKSAIETKKINNNTWSKMTVTSSYDIYDYYAITKDDVLYSVKFYSTSKQKGTCSTYFNETLNSLKFN